MVSVVSFHCMQMSLVSMQFIFGDDWSDAPCSLRAFYPSFSTVHVFPVVANTCTKPVQKQLVEYDTKSKYPKEYSTADNVESEKTFGE